MKLSIVTTLFKSSAYVEEFYLRITKEVKKLTDDYEIIFVDDGSPDDSLQKCITLHQQDQKVTVLELSRNFGHHKAIMTGLSHAQGDFVFLIDVDLEEKPELLGKFWQELQNGEDLDVVYGVQQQRKGAFFERISGRLFWKVINIFSTIEIPKNILTARLVTKAYNDALIKYQESELFIGGIWADTGFRQKPIITNKSSKSETSYTFRKKIYLLITSITSFSSKPLVYIFNIGLLTTFVSFLFILKLLYNKLFYGVSFEGWTSLIVSVWFFGGLIILLLGIIGIYLSKIFIETKNRPYTIVRKYYKQQ
ncbi:glycosyltransferase family 2 protein [Candidatus Pseudothioglobus sp. Uisw_086]|uniref:glycosyltransferase family 2 protein n=1 Tax=Candidatus Pseudothioglobus sp. Uisw_086 TaxID=3230998 RepID=UPI003A8B23DD